MIGASCSHTRCSTPPRCSTAYQPSAPCRSSPLASPPKLRLTEVCVLNDEAGRTGMTVGRTSGAQKTVCSRKDRSGSAAKTQPPTLAEIGGCGKGLLACDRSMMALKIVVAAQAFPGQPSQLRALRTVICDRRHPIELRHLRPHSVPRNCGAIILGSNGCS